MNRVMASIEDSKPIVHAITDFLQSEQSRSDLSYEQKENLRKCIIFLKMVYGHRAGGSSPRRSLSEMYSQLANPVTVKDKKLAENFNKSGNAKMQLRRYMEADVDYTISIRLDKWNSVAYCNRAAARIRLGGFRDAIDDCKRAVQLSPDYAKAFGRMGHAYVELNDSRRAMSCFQKAVELDPENRQYWNNLRVARQQAILRDTREMSNLFHDLLPLVLGVDNPRNSQINSVVDGITTIVLRREINDVDTSGQIFRNGISDRESSGTNNSEVDRLMDILFPLFSESAVSGSEGHRPRFPYTSTSSENPFENSTSSRTTDREGNTTREGDTESTNCLFKLFSR